MVNFIFEGARINHAPDFISKYNIELAKKFYDKLSDYEPTPLLSLDSLAEELGLSKILVKDESKRFSLNSFKSIGGLYAVYKVICDAAKREELSLNKAGRFAKGMVFVTATDGNHGRGIAYAANRFHARSVIFMPKGTAETRIKNIEKIPGAKVIVTDSSYDFTVQMAGQYADAIGGYLIQDTAFKGYSKVPGYICTGYCLMAEEELKQAEDFTHVFLQAGVGSMAASVAAYYKNYMKAPPQAIIVEPSAAPCIYESVKSRKKVPLTVESRFTIMAGLNGQTPSLDAWEVLRDMPEAYAKIDDEIARVGMRVFKRYGIVSGESGAATMGLLYTIMTAPMLEGVRIKLKLNKDAKVLLFSTEGNTSEDGEQKGYKN